MQESLHLGNEDTVDVIIFKLEALCSSFQNQIWNIICFIFSWWGLQSPVKLFYALLEWMANWPLLHGETSHYARHFLPL